MSTVSHPDRALIEKAIKDQKWDRGSYEYALNAMNPHHFYNDSSIYKKADLIKLFYELIETKWNCIKNYTTFRNL